MGMECQFNHISTDLLEKLKKTPALVEPFLVAMPPAIIPGIPKDITENIAADPFLDDMRTEMQDAIKEICPKEASKIIEETKKPGFSIDKNFQEIHFLLTGNPENGEGLLSESIFGGEEIGDDLGYGPARYHGKAKVVEISRALSNVTEAEFKTKHKIPDDFDWEEDTIDYAWELFKEMTAYYKEAVAQSHALIVHFC